MPVVVGSRWQETLPNWESESDADITFLQVINVDQKFGEVEISFCIVLLYMLKAIILSLLLLVLTWALIVMMRYLKTGLNFLRFSFIPLANRE